MASIARSADAVRSAVGMHRANIKSLPDLAAAAARAGWAAGYTSPDLVILTQDADSATFERRAAGAWRLTYLACEDGHRRVAVHMQQLGGLPLVVDSGRSETTAGWAAGVAVPTTWSPRLRAFWGAWCDVQRSNGL